MRMYVSVCVCVCACACVAGELVDKESEIAVVLTTRMDTYPIPLLFPTLGCLCVMEEFLVCVRARVRVYLAIFKIIYFCI